VILPGFSQHQNIWGALATPPATPELTAKHSEYVGARAGPERRCVTLLI